VVIEICIKYLTSELGGLIGFSPVRHCVRIPHGEKPARGCFGGGFLTFPAELRFLPEKWSKLGPDLETLKPGSFFSTGAQEGGCCGFSQRRRRAPGRLLLSTPKPPPKRRRPRARGRSRVAFGFSPLVF
jgi:hypothetical protein